MSVNFEILKKDWPYLYELASLAEAYVYTDPQSSVSKIRLLAEKYTDLIASYEDIDFDPMANQLQKLNTLKNYNVLDEEYILLIFHNIRKEGNKAVHDRYDNSELALGLLRRAHFLTNWFIEVYGDHTLETNPHFINPVEIKEEKTEPNPGLEKEFEQSLTLVNEAARILPADEKVQKQESRKRKSRDFLSNANLSESETRELFIDPKLREAGWLADTRNLNWSLGSRPKAGLNQAIAEVPVVGGTCDYMLFVGLRPVGIVEAKKFGKDIASDLEQAKTYATNPKTLDFYIGKENLAVAEDNGSFDKDKIPFVYASNGREYIRQLESKSGIWFYDTTEKAISKAIGSFHSPTNLLEKIDQDKKKANRKLHGEDYPAFANRHYQIEAIRAVERAIEQGQDRMLLALATGTGKTRLAISLMYRLIKAKRFRRILFLVNRKTLGLQTLDSLTDLEIEGQAISSIYDIKGLDDIYPEIETKIQVATVQGMVRRLFYNENEDKTINSGDYDFIIVDEAHRGYIEDKDMTDDELVFKNSENYISQYRRVIDYFDTTVLGLTATPALHTTEIFGKPIYTYSYKQAVLDGYLVDHEPPYTINTELNQNGIKFEKGEEIEIYNKNTGTIEKHLLEDELNFDVDQFNKKVITESFNRVVLRELTNYIDPTAPGKTLIFAANNSHADMVVDILKEEYIASGYEISDDTIMKITGEIYNQELAIKRFKNENNPKIVVTVDLLTTGVDVPEITNLVFLRRVRSRILFEQMLGRATRLAPDINKSTFLIFDPVNLFDHLNDVTDMKAVAVNPNQTIKELLVDMENIDHKDQFDYYKDELVAKLQRKKHLLDEKAIKDLEDFLEIEDLDSYIRKINDMDLQQILDNKDALITIAQKRKTTEEKIIISHDPDRIISVERGYGKKDLKPDDYLNEFKNFIINNIDLVDALQIVVQSPKDLKYKDLMDIKRILKEEYYDENTLNSAWKESKKEHIAADIISFIRQAALGTELLDHEDKVKRAMREVYKMNNWNSRQMNFLNRIESQLLKTPVLAPTAKEYFDETEIWKQNGGYKLMQSIFKDDIEIIIDTINTNLYQ